MEHRDSVDFLDHLNPAEPERLARQRLSSLTRLFATLVVVGAIGGVFVSAHIARTTDGGLVETPGMSLFSSLRRLVGAPDKALGGESGDRINVLLLGIGGAGHDGPELTDTIIFGSFKPSTSQVGLISIPRDLTVAIDGYGYRKINHVNALAEIEDEGSGLDAAKTTVGKIMGETVNYVVKVDFGGFEEIIDDIGGIDVYDDTAFTDPTYPIDDDIGSTTSVSFAEGWTHMDGASALIYARSRHGTGGEGSDFARAARQQKILLAVKDQALSMSVLLNPAKLNRLLGTINSNVETDLSIWEMMKFARYIPSVDMDLVAMHVLDSGPQSPLYASTVNGAYVLLPKEDDWSDLHDLADTIFAVEGATTAGSGGTQPQKPSAMNAVVVEVQNGTPVTGLAARTAELLQSSGFTIAAIRNAADRTREQTVIYDFTGGEKSRELEALRDYLNAEIVMSPGGYLATSTVVPDSIAPIPETETENIDFLIIIGENSEELVMN